MITRGVITFRRHCSLSAHNVQNKSAEPLCCLLCVVLLWATNVIFKTLSAVTCSRLNFLIWFVYFKKKVKGPYANPSQNSFRPSSQAWGVSIGVFHLKKLGWLADLKWDHCGQFSFFSFFLPPRGLQIHCVNLTCLIVISHLKRIGTITAFEFVFLCLNLGLSLSGRVIAAVSSSIGSLEFDWCWLFTFPLWRL